MLWLALYLPRLPLDLVFRSQPDSASQACVIYEQQGNRQLVVQASAAARSEGVQAGQTLASARALCNELLALQRQPEDEGAALQQLAQWALQYTSLTSLQSPNGLLLEIGASLKLFDGIPTLTRQIQQNMRSLGYANLAGIAPTASGAWLLAYSRSKQCTTSIEALEQQLDTLPLQYLDLKQKQQEALLGMGLATLADCRKLPRQGLAKRLGTAVVEQLDRAYGDKRDPRTAYQPPQIFHSRISFPEPVLQIEALLFPLRRQLIELCGFLLARNSGVQTLALHFMHPQQADSGITLGLLSPSRDRAQLEQLWREKLERHTLDGPVETITLQADKLQPLDAINLDLLGNNVQTTTDFRLLLERLSNRLGSDAVFRLQARPEHRPEKAWQQLRPGEKLITNTPAAPPRPLWLLEQAKPLQHSGIKGQLTLVSGPERIESGWWDDAPIRRDYYIASATTQQLLWIYQEVNAQQEWYLQGYFG